MFWRKKKTQDREIVVAANEEVVIEVDTVSKNVNASKGYKPNENYPIEVQQIHSEFFTSSDVLLEEANKIIEESRGKDIEKGKRLAKLGFSKSPEAVGAMSIEEELANNEKVRDLVFKYRTKYPNNKFITEDQVKGICEKYNLVHGPIDRYKGFVPEKNLSEIEKFVSTYDFDIWSNENGLKLDMSNYEIRKERGYYHFYEKGNKDSERHLQMEVGEDFFYGSGHVNGEYIYISGFRNYIRKEKIGICAPLKDMDTTGMRVSGYKLKKHIPDPVVLQPIDGGYLIVTAWGDEASDPEVVNENMN